MRRTKEEAEQTRAALLDAALAGELRPHTVAPGDHVEIREPGGRRRRGAVTEVRGQAGLPPWLVQWEDDPDTGPHEIVIVPGTPIALDGCER